MKNGFAFAGMNAYRAKEIVSVETLIQTLAEGYNRAVAAANPSRQKETFLIRTPKPRSGREGPPCWPDNTRKDTDGQGEPYR